MKGEEKTEGSPLVGTGSSSAAADPEKTPAEKLQTAVSLVALVTIAVTKTQLTAELFHSSNYPTAYSLWTCLVTDLLLVPVFVVQYFAYGKVLAFPTREMGQVLFLIVFFTAVDLGCTNIALANISTALQQCVYATVPFWTILFETALYQKYQHALIYFAVVMLVVGAVLASVGSVSRMHVGGLIAAVIAALCSASKIVFTHSAFKKFKGQLGALPLLFWVDLFMLPIMLVWSLSNGELQELISVGFASASVFWSMTGTAALGGVRALTQYVVLALVSATSMSTANIFTLALNEVVSIINPHQHVEINAALIAGICVIISATAFYAFMKSHRPFLPWFDTAVLGKPPASETGKAPA